MDETDDMGYWAFAEEILHQQFLEEQTKCLEKLNESKQS